MQHEEIADMDFDEYLARRTSLDDSEQDYSTEDDLVLPEPTQSGRSSISSFPASIVHHNITPSQTYSQRGLHTPSRSLAGTPTARTPNYQSAPPASAREHVTGFRNPSSVRALQMRDELSDGEDFTPGHRRRGSRMSFMSYRSSSTHSTPGKRMSRSLQGSPVKHASKLRKEFPLVLLHCSILPSSISPKATSVNLELLEAIIPEPYKRRWKLLQEKVAKNVEVRDRGVLIPHPRDEYDLLEERLLESLELDEPVVNHGHFVGRSESRASTTDSGFASEENSSRGDATDEETDDRKCTDCGGQICGDSRWEIKVFAANGLMRAGAWGAVWSDMEKVDVQVSVRLPEGVRQEIETRLDAVLAQEQQLQEDHVSGTEVVGDDERTREIYGESSKNKTQEEIDGLKSDDRVLHSRLKSRTTGRERTPLESSPLAALEKVDLQVALMNYVQLLLQDRRNIAIVLLSILLISYGITNRQTHITEESIYTPAVTTSIEARVEYLTTTVVSTSTAIALETSTVTETVRSVDSTLPSVTMSVYSTPTVSSIVIANASVPLNAAETVPVGTALSSSTFESPGTSTSIQETPPSPAPEKLDSVSSSAIAPCTVQEPSLTVHEDTTLPTNGLENMAKDEL